MAAKKDCWMNHFTAVGRY